MKIENLKIGDKLKMKKDIIKGGNLINKIGTITFIDKDNERIQVLFENIGYGVYDFDEINEYLDKVDVEEVYIESKEEIERIIVNENKRTCVVILKGGIKGKAKCLPEDIFNKDVGIKIAYSKAKIKQLYKEIKSY